MHAGEADASLTNRQQLVWLEQQLAPDVPMNNQVMTFEIDGHIEPERLVRAFDAAVRESDALRTVIEELDGTPRQRALTEPPARMQLVDLSSDPDAFGAWLDDRATRRFELSRAAYDTAIVKLGPARWCWFLCLHHAITDGRSFEVLYDRVAQLYLDPDAPASPAASYAEYRVAERAYRGSAPAALAGAFWSEKLATPADPLPFYGEAVRAEGPAVRRESIEVESATSRKLEALARDQLGAGLSPDLAMTALFAALLAVWTHRVSRGRRIRMGFPLQNRRTRPLRRTIGLLMEVQVLQLDVDPKESFKSLLQKAHDELIRVFAHARYCNASNPYDVMLSYNPARFPAFAGWPTRVEALSGRNRMPCTPANSSPRASRRPRVALQVQDFEGRGRHRLDFDLSAGAFSGERATRVRRHFDRLLQAVASAPSTPIRDIPLFDSDESRALFSQVDLAEEGPDLLAESVEDLVTSARRHVAPRNELERCIATAWSETLRVPAIGVHDDFFDLGGHSFAALDLFRRLRRCCGVDLPLAALFRAPTVADMAELVEEHRTHGAPAWSTLVELHGGGDLPPLYCAAGAGGNVTNLRALAARLGERQPFYGLQTRGVVGDLDMPDRIEEIARESLADIRRFQPRGPYYLAGYSAGGAVAFEMARMLERDGERVGALLLFDAYAPSLRPRSRIERLSIHGARLRRDGPAYLAHKLRDRIVGDAMRVRDGLRRLRVRLRPARYRHELFMQRRSTIQRSYLPDPSLGTGVLFRVARSEDELDTRLAIDDTNGWSRELLGGVEVVTVPGGHLDMCEEPHVRVLAARVAEVLAGARRRAEGERSREVA